MKDDELEMLIRRGAKAYRVHSDGTRLTLEECIAEREADKAAGWIPITTEHLAAMGLEVEPHDPLNALH